MSPLRILASVLLLNLCSLFPTAGIAQAPSGPLIWLDASDLEAGQPIERWSDKSGKHNDAVMTEADHRPAVITEGNGVKALQFLWGQYFNAPSIFPMLSDYTIVAVVRSRDTSTVSNIVSGDHRGFWFDSKPKAALVHDDRFYQVGLSERSIREGYNILVAEYREATGMAIHYCNGQFGDSLWIDSNHDSTLYISSYAKSYFSNLDIAEVLIYDRVISESERTSFETALFDKYKLTPPTPLPSPDLTFSQLPQNMQLYARDANNNAKIPITGRLAALGWDSITVSVFRAGAPYQNESLPLQYSDGFASFNFQPVIKSELQNYDFEVRVKSAARDSLLARREKIVAGDVYLIGGASNATFGAWSWKNENEFCRTFGMNLSHNARDTAWTMSQVDPWGAGPSVSGWGATIQNLIADKHQIPTAIINWAVGGTILVHHLKKPGLTYDLRTIYGRLLYRLDKAGLRDAVKAHIFWHGELHNPEGYAHEFYALYDSLSNDIPSIQKTYIMQLRPSHCSNLGNMMLREFQRHLQDSFPRIETIATAGFADYDGCHYTDDGWREAGTKIFNIIGRDFYGATDTNFLRSPTLRRARYTSEAHDRIELEFEPVNYTINVGKDGVFEGVLASILDYFYLDTTWGKINGITWSGNKLFLGLKEPVYASTISYLPDRHYHGTEVIYRGPWLTTDAGMGVLAFQNVPLTVKSAVTPQQNIELSLFPDPATDKVRIRGEIDPVSDTYFCLFDSYGREVLRSVIPPTEQVDRTLDVSALPRGAYSLRISSGSFITFQKLILH
jgi:hypothetical protein